MLKAFGEIKRVVKSGVFFGKDLFYFIFAQQVLGYHLIYKYHDIYLLILVLRRFLDNVGQKVFIGGSRHHAAAVQIPDLGPIIGILGVSYITANLYCIGLSACFMFASGDLCRTDLR